MKCILLEVKFASLENFQIGVDCLASQMSKISSGPKSDTSSNHLPLERFFLGEGGWPERAWRVELRVPPSKSGDHFVLSHQQWFGKEGFVIPDHDVPLNLRKTKID